MTDVYQRLTRDFPDLAEMIAQRKEIGLRTYNGRPLKSGLKETWLPDADEELGDAMIYLELEAEIASGKKMRDDSEYHCYFVLRGAIRKIASALADIREAKECRAGAKLKPKGKRPRHLAGEDRGS